MKFFKLLSVCICSAFVFTNCYAKKSTVERVGDYMQVIVPAYAFGLAMNEEDYTGAKQFAYSFGAMEATVYGLKYTVRERRPNKADNSSFPSGHTASAMSGAAFIHKRYGLKRAIVPYLMTGFTGYSRVFANKHFWWDVMAGATIGAALSFAIVDKYERTQISVGPQHVAFTTKF